MECIDEINETTKMILCSHKRIATKSYPERITNDRHSIEVFQIVQVED
jgi:hypothetical protein